MNIREVRTDDATALLAIYAPYVTDTAITFEYDVPTEDEFRRRISHVTSKHPWIVAEEDGKIIGYAYADDFKARDAYRHSVETSIYVEHTQKHHGVGRALLTALEERLRRQGILNANACIAYSETEDETLNLDSVRFHQSMGYRQVAHFHLCGRKFHRWYDMIWMEKFLGEHT